MIPLTQSDPRWSNDQLGTCPDATIGKDGCFITCLAMMDDTTPPIVNEQLTRQAGYIDGCLVSQQAAAAILGLVYSGKVTSRPSQDLFPCIAETNYWSEKGVPQHFFIDLGNGRILDPLDKKEKDNIYALKTVSYRLFSVPVTIDPMDAQKEARLEYLEGILKGTGKSSVFVTPDGQGSQLIYYQGEDQIRELNSMAPDQPITYVPVVSVDIVALNEIAVSDSDQKIAQIKQIIN